VPGGFAALPSGIKSARTASSAARITRPAQKSSRGHERGCGLLKMVATARATSRRSPAKRYHRGMRGLGAAGAAGTGGAGGVSGAGGATGRGGLWPRIKERTPAPTGAAASFGSLPMSAPKSRPNPCFAIGRSLFEDPAGHNSFFAGGGRKLDIRQGGIILRVVIFTKVFLLKLLLGFGFGLIILALL
jgi:hypothetical protein